MELSVAVSRVVGIAVPPPHGDVHFLDLSLWIGPTERVACRLVPDCLILHLIAVIGAAHCDATGDGRTGGRVAGPERSLGNGPGVGKDGVNFLFDDRLGHHHAGTEIGRLLAGPEHASQSGHHKEANRGEYGQTDDQLDDAETFAPHGDNFYLQRWFFLESVVYLQI